MPTGPLTPYPGSGDPGSELYDHFTAGSALLAEGNPAQAALRLEKACALDATRGSVREALGRAYFMMGRWEDSEHQFRALVDLAPTNDYAHYCLSRALRKQGRTQEAEGHLKLARVMNPDEAIYRLLPGR